MIILCCWILISSFYIYFFFLGEYVNDYGTPEFQRPILFPYFQEFIKVPKYSENVVAAAPIRNHRLQLRDGTLKFRLNDGNLRTARGFGKRSYFIDADDYRINRWASQISFCSKRVKKEFSHNFSPFSMSSGDVLKAILNQNSQQPLKSNNNPKDNNKEEIWINLFTIE